MFEDRGPLRLKTALLEARAFVSNEVVFDPSEKHMEDLKEFFKRIERNSFTFIWEPRGQWGRKEVEELCEESDVVPCLDPYDNPFPGGDLIYLRLHGKRGYRYRYSKEDLLELLERVRLSQEAYVMFNNLRMYEDAQRLKKLRENQFRKDPLTPKT